VHVGDQLVDKVLGEGRKEPSAVPGDQDPAPDGCSTIGNGHCPDTLARNADIGRHNRYTFAVGRERYQGMQGGAFQNDWRSDIRIVTSGVEPTARAEPTLQEQQRFIRELTNIDRARPPKRMRRRGPRPKRKTDRASG
jgi:hypothetical protein